MKKETYPHDHTEESEKDKSLTAGGRLQEIRREKSFSIKDVSEATKISTSNIQAMEDYNFDKLPGNPFLKGQVVIYCRFLGVEGETVAAEFLTARKEKIKEKTSVSFTHEKLSEPFHVSSIIIAILILGAIIISLTAFSLYTSWNPFSDTDKQVFGFSEQENKLQASLTIPKDMPQQ